MTADDRATRKNGAGSGKTLPALCNVLGTMMIVAVIALCLPLAIPNVLGYQVFNVISGSMEPAIPVGSAIYVRDVDPTEIDEGQIIAFYEEGDVVTHRVTANLTSASEVVTKGDANEVEDFKPVPYDEVIGVVDYTAPMIGAFMSIYASVVGKVYLLLTAACGLMLNILASRMRADRREREREIDRKADALGLKGESHGEPEQDASQPKKRGRGWRQIAAIVLSVVFIGSAGVIGFTMFRYMASDALYGDAADKYTYPGDVAPISIDFDSLRAKNPDIVGWIYCEGTRINYPVLQGKDNDEYLHTDYTGAYNFDGSIFVDGDNTPGFIDSNTILYGHHMNSGAMFAGLLNWEEQAYYDEHPIIWLLTPEKDYEIVLFSGHHVSSSSSMYDIVKYPGPEMDTLISEALKLSDFKWSGGFDLNPRGRYVMLSTCAYLFDGDRYVLHGILVTATGSETG